MNAGMLLGRDSRLLVPLFVLAGILAQPGCDKSASDSQPDEKPAYAASGGVPSVDGGEIEQDQVDPTQTEKGPANSSGDSAAEETAGGLMTIASPDQEAIDGPKIAADVSAAKLSEFLAIADEEMALVMSGRSGIEDQALARKALLRIIRTKLEASRRLVLHADADPAMRIEGARGELEALSHLASQGDLKSAVELESLAKKNLQADDKQLAAYSRLVLIGFAIESLDHGDESAVERIVSMVDVFSNATDSPDVPALMVMAKARQALAQFGHHEEAMKIRKAIIDLYADASDPQVAEMAAQAAGNVQSEEIEQLRVRALTAGGESVSAEQWQESVEALIDESADMLTVQYLAASALQFESIGQDALVAATFQSLAKHFNDPSSATGREVELAIDAREARRQMIGRPFDPLLPGVDGEPLQMGDYRGKVVLMPFWATGFPDSLQLISEFEAIEQANQDDVVIVGMNLDVEGAGVKEFMKANDLKFPSFRAVSSPTTKVANPMAAKFGMVSMPFTAIIDQEGRVAVINYDGQQLKETVDQLIKTYREANKSDAE